MNFGPPPQPEDPLLKAEKTAAANEKVDAIRTRVSSLTDQLFRMYGARAALSPNPLKVPPIAGGYR